MSFSQTNEIYEKFLENENNFTSKEYNIFSDFIINKFNETSAIFSKFEETDFKTFLKLSNIKNFTDNEIIFKKEDPCLNYIFIVYGDINFYDNEELNDNNQLIKTISAGTIYGHKIKDKYRFYGRCRIKATTISIEKNKFDNLIIEINKRKSLFKLNYIKKFFPKMRLFTDDIIENILQFFVREKYPKYSKIFSFSQFDEYVYLIISGEIAVAKKPKTLELDDKINDQNINYFILEKFKRGDLFGVYSALKDNRCNYTAICLSDVELYKISKSHLLFYFGGRNGVIPKNLSAIDSLQQISHDMKITYIKNHSSDLDIIKSISLIFENNNIKNDNKGIKIDENEIKNNLFEAWKELVNLDSKLADFKRSLLSNDKKKKTVDIFERMKDTNNKEKDFSKISGDATNRVVGRKLRLGLNDNQLSGMQKLNMLSGIKKEDESGLKKLAEISSKMEGKKNNRLFGMFEKNNNEEKEIKNKEEEKTENKNDNPKNIINKEGEKKFKRPKHSLKNLMGEI